MLGRIFGFGVLLSFVGLVPFCLLYVFDWKSSWLWIVQLISSFSILGFFAYRWVVEGEELKGFKGFVSWNVSILSVLLISSLINLLSEYLVYNHIDREYKYRKEERSFQFIVNHRRERGLPAPFAKTDLEIQEKYGFAGLFKEKQPGYVINFMYAMLFYPIAVGFAYLLQVDGSGQRRRPTDA